MEKQDSSTYWSDRYKSRATQWDIGQASTPLIVYFDQLKNKNIEILIPGSGNSYEAEYLHRSGFKNVHVLDFAKQPLEFFKTRVPDFPKEHIIFDDFFEHQGQYDLIIEQTFFCSFHPDQRPQYVEKMNHLLSRGGKLVGLLFDAPLNTDQPPYGGNRESYRRLFSQKMIINKMEECYNSIPPRSGRELFINCTSIIGA